MQRFHLIIVFFAISVFFISCSKKEAEMLRVTSTLPNGIIGADATFSIEFSKRVVPQESLNVWMNAQFITFTPDIQGKFVWQDTSLLVFSPDKPFSGDTKFKGTLNTSLLLKYSGMKSFDGNETFSFSTEAFAMRKADFFYDRLGEKRIVGIKANLEFTYAVDPVQVSKYLSVTIDDQPVAGVTVMTTQASRVIPVEIGIVEQKEKDKIIKVSFNTELVSSETGTHIAKEAPFQFTLPGIGHLEIYGHDFGYDGSSGWITIKTSQEIDSASARAFIEITPQKNYKFEGDRNNFTMRGDFGPGSTYHLLIKKGLESVLGAKTENEYEADIVIGNIKPAFRYSSTSGMYMLLGGQRNIEIKSINMTAVSVKVYQVFQNNLTYFLENGRQYDYSWEYDEDEGSGSYRASKYRFYIGNYGREVWQDSIKVNNIRNQEVSTLFNISPYIQKDYKGFYIVDIANPSEPWRATSKLISISDLGITVKRSAKEIVVFVTNLLSTEPVEDATVNLVSSSNQVIASIKTSGDGIARFSKYDEIKKDFTLKLVTAEHENDFNFINLDDYRVETSRFDVSGKYDSENKYDAFFYGDRTLYRPGETVYLSGIIRDLNNPIPAKMPVKVKVINPRGSVVKELQQSLNEQGSFELNYPTSVTSPTGSYTFELRTGNDIYMSSYAVSVEDFVPDRLKVNVKASTDKASPGDALSYQIEAINFFGPPASGRKYEYEGTFSEIPFTSKKFAGFRFDDEAAKTYSGSPIMYDGTTDNNGKATVSFKIPTGLTSSGLLRLRGKVAVFDESGRPVYQSANVTVYPKDYFIGIKNLGEYYCRPQASQTAELIALDKSGNAINGFKAKVELIRYEWQSVLKQHQGSGTLRYVSERIEKVMRADTVVLGAEPIQYKYSADRSGEYILRVSKAGDDGYNQFFFYSYSWGSSDVTSFEVDPEARVQIVMNDSVYTPGEKARLLFKTPFDGKLLITVERNSVYKYYYLNAVNNAASLEIPVEDEYLPNVYVSAVLFRKITDHSLPLLAGHGFAPLFVEKNTNKISITIKSPDKIRPKTKQVVTIKVGNESNIFITLAAVDEGILQLKNYQTPDAYKYFYMRKALQTETFDFFKHLLPEPEKSSTGGSDADMAQRVNPLGVLRFKPVSLWSGIVKTNSSGEADITLNVPEFNGELRLMALAYKGDRFGMAQKAMKVADPVVITPALPRFLSPNDSISMPVTAFNTTDKPTKLTFAIATTGGLIAVMKTVTLELGANQERYVTVPLKTTNEVGKATVTVSTTAFGEKLEATTELPIRPIAPYTSESQSGFAENGKNVSHAISDRFLSFGRKAYITLSPFPVANFAKELKYLIGYPHGCLEQTTSKAFPQIYLRDIATMLDPSILNSGSPTYFVNEAITKIVSMQRTNGEFSYWPGEDYSYDWTTVYATHFLLEAKKAGYAVPEQTIKSALNAIRAYAKSQKTRDYYTYSQGKVTVRRIADKDALYAIYVLAAGGAPEKNVMDFYRTNKSLLTTDTRYLLAAAYALNGDRTSSLELLPKDFITEEAQRTTGEDFDSPVRANALILNLLLETDLSSPKIPMYMDYLSKQYKTDRWYSTQDNAFTLLAFGKAARMATATKLQGTIKVGTKDYSYTGGNQKFDIDPFGKTVTLSMKGEGRVYYSIVTSGIRTDGKIPVEDKSLQIRREFFRRDGSIADPFNVKQNELLVVKLTLITNVNPIDNIAITDLLPGGFEIENPRLSESSTYSFIKEENVPDYMDIRDDRMNIYTHFYGSKKQQFYYLVRVVSTGLFQYAPVVAEAMYNADYYSASGGGKIRVSK